MTLLARLDDAWNPVLVKEVRAALRQRYFRVGFVVALFVSTLTTAAWAANLTVTVDVDGGPIFALLQAALGLAAYGIVPVGAWFSMDEECGDGRIDLLLLTRLSARRVLLGKLAAAMVQVALFVAAFAPFFTFTFLMRGVEPGLVRGAVIEVFARSAMLTSLALALASAVARGTLRSTLVTLLGLAGAAAVGVQVMRVWLVSASSLQAMSPYPSLVNQLLGASLDLALAAAFLSAAYARIEHSAINRSTRVRIVISVCVVALVVRILGFEPPVRATEGWLRLHSAVAVLIVIAPAAIFVTEPERSRRARRRWVPKRPWTAALAAPWIPGGGTGVLWATTHLILVAFGFIFASGVRDVLGVSALDLDDWGVSLAIWIGFLGYSAIVVPGTAMFIGTPTERMRWWMRIAIPCGAFALAVFGLTVSFIAPRVANVLFALMGSLTTLAVVIGLSQSLAATSLSMQDARLAPYWRQRERGHRYRSKRRPRPRPRPGRADPGAGPRSGPRVRARP